MTNSYLLESALDAFLEGTETVRPAKQPPEPSFRCPFCDVSWSTPSGLEGHVSNNHAVARPFLLIDGAEPSRTAHLRSPATSFAIINTTAVEVSLRGRGKTITTPKKLIQDLEQLKEDQVSIRLENRSEPRAAPVTSCYEISFRIVAPRVLRAVEVAFMEHLNDAQLTRTRIDQFLLDPRCRGSARDYADSLASFGFGVLVKERPSTEMLSSPVARYRELYGTALADLAERKRPLACLISAIIRFALNDFRDAGPPTGFWELDLTRALLNKPSCKAMPFVPRGGVARRKISPLDHATGQILDLGARMFRQRRWSAILSDECRQAAASSVLDETDRQKALAIWAVAAWRLGAKTEATEPLRQISAVHPFRSWAEPYLESLTP